MSDASKGACPSEEYRIGTVARLTGLTPDLIRAWERRYGVVEPTRSDTGLRLYTRHDVRRLLLVKRLVDRGEPIGSVAGLSLGELKGRLDAMGQLSADRAAAPLHVDSRTSDESAAPEKGRPEARRDEARQIPSKRPRPDLAVPLLLLDSLLESQLRASAGSFEEIRVVGAVDSIDEMDRALEEEGGPLVAVLRLRTIGSDPLGAVRRVLGHPRVVALIVVYNFASRRTIHELTRMHVRMVQSPVELELFAASARELYLEALGAEESPPRPESVADIVARVRRDHGLEEGENPPPRFSEVQLARLREIESALDCECPHHLSSIVLSLLAFEKYSADCENLEPRDAVVHARLYRETGAARVIMEEALAYLCEQEGIDL